MHLLATLNSDGFGYWLAGLMDGEGTFQITPNRPGFACRASIGLREDDSAIVQAIADRTGLGKVFTRPQSDASIRRLPLAVWRVQRKAECQMLCSIFDTFPLRSKKARDYSIWRQAVFVMAKMQPTGRQLDWQEIADLKVALSDVRKHPAVLLKPAVAQAS